MKALIVGGGVCGPVRQWRSGAPASTRLFSRRVAGRGDAGGSLTVATNGSTRSRAIDADRR